ncbi:MAG TPA: hypothetical protein PK503_02380, partial [Azonexus sp.]|nr:hypothetical protein [Azonexus sp.]
FGPPRLRAQVADQRAAGRLAGAHAQAGEIGGDPEPLSRLTTTETRETLQKVAPEFLSFAEHIFIFSNNSARVSAIRQVGYQPTDLYPNDAGLKEALDRSIAASSHPANARAIMISLTAWFTMGTITCYSPTTRTISPPRRALTPTI